MSPDPAQDITRWFEEGQRLFGTWVERVERLEQLQLTLERDREQLRRTITQLEHDNEILRAQREELLAAFDALAGNVTQVVDEVLQRFRRENLPGGSGSARPDRKE
jgi:chromosome segregation ATPase